MTERGQSRGAQAARQSASCGRTPRDPSPCRGNGGFGTLRGRNEKIPGKEEKGGHLYSRDHPKRSGGATGKGCLNFRIPHNRP